MRRLQAAERFVFLFEGRLWRVHERAVIVPNELPHLLGRLFSGRFVTEEAFAAFGMRLTVEEGMDQGDDGPDAPCLPHRFRDD